MIESIEIYTPEIRLTNQMLESQFPEWPANKIYDKTGIVERHISAATESATDLAFEAGRRLLREKKTTEIDFVIFCSQTSGQAIPAKACLLQHRLGIPSSCGAIDINQGCSGFVYCLAVAIGLFNSIHCRQILLFNSDTYSKILSPTDRSTRTIFGDAAAATLLTRDNEPRIHSFEFGTDGSGADWLKCSDRAPFELGNNDQEYLVMNGPEVFNFTLERVPQMVTRILEKGNLGINDIDYYVFHQANRFMLDHLRKRLKIPEDRFPIYIQNYGNTVSATIPIVLKELTVSGKLKTGSRLLLAGFGVGLSWSGCIVEWK